MFPLWIGFVSTLWIFLPYIARMRKHLVVSFVRLHS